MYVCHKSLLTYVCDVSYVVYDATYAVIRSIRVGSLIPFHSVYAAGFTILKT